jgi:hypothetical protein
MSPEQILSSYRHFLKNAIIELQIITTQNETDKLDDKEFLDKVAVISQRILSEAESIS